MCKRNDFLGLKNLTNLKVLITIAFFSAISIILGKFLALPVGQYMRFSFENLPLVLSGLLFGPISGLLSGVIADLLGCVLRGYEINPILTVGAAVLGFTAGLVFQVLKKIDNPLRVMLSVIIPHTLGSVLIKSYGLSLWYSLEFSVVLSYRTLNYIIVAIAEIIVITLMLKNKGFMSQIFRLTGDKNEL